MKVTADVVELDELCEGDGLTCVQLGELSRSGVVVRREAPQSPLLPFQRDVVLVRMSAISVTSSAAT